MATTRVHIICDPADRLDRRVGRVHWTIGERAFPAADWTDFVPVVVGWWLDEARGVRPRRASFLFMDGPYSVEVMPTRGEVVRLDCVDHDQVVATDEVSWPDLRRAIRVAAATFCGAPADLAWNELAARVRAFDRSS
jgi:hypothetical protein